MRHYYGLTCGGRGLTEILLYCFQGSEDKDKDGNNSGGTVSGRERGTRPGVPGTDDIMNEMAKRLAARRAKAEGLTQVRDNPNPLNYRCAAADPHLCVYYTMFLFCVFTNCVNYAHITGLNFPTSC